MKKIFCVLLSGILILSVFFSCGVPSYASFNSLLETEADVVMLVNTDTGDVIFDKNSAKKTAPASLTKIVTCMLVLENCEDLNTKVTAKFECLDGLYAMNAATVGILAGEQLTVDELLHCLMIPSAADAANILADYIGGSIENFVVMMNDFVKNLGCENTNFINPSGLDNGDTNMYTTAEDLYKITSYALKNPQFKELCSILRYQIEPTEKYPHTRYLNNTNKMLNPAYKDYYSPNVFGVKTGTTGLAGHCVITTASKNGYNYMLIVLNAPQYDIDGDGVEENVAFTDSKKIYEWAFNNIVLTKVTSKTDIVTVVDVKYNWKTDHLALVPEEELSALVPTGTETGSLQVRTIEKETPKTVNAPIKKGDVIGKAEVLYGDSIVATVNLVASEDVSGSVILRITGFLGTLFRTTVMKILICLAILLIIIYILLIVRRNRIRAKRRKPRRIK